MTDSAFRPANTMEKCCHVCDNPFLTSAVMPDDLCDACMFGDVDDCLSADNVEFTDCLACGDQFPYCLPSGADPPNFCNWCELTDFGER